jgi:hypothetical protein
MHLASYHIVRRHFAACGELLLVQLTENSRFLARPTRSYSVIRTLGILFAVINHQSFLRRFLGTQVLYAVRVPGCR